MMLLPAVFMGAFIGHAPAGTTWAQTDIEIPAVVHHAPGELACGWIMAQLDNYDVNTYVQIGWASDDKGTFPFIEHRDGASTDWHRVTWVSDPLQPGERISVALSNDEGTNTWHYWLDDHGTWVQLTSSTASFTNESAVWERFTELHDDGGVEPSVGPSAFTNTGLVTLGAWRPQPNLTTKARP